MKTKTNNNDWLFNLILKYSGELLALAGTGIFIYNILNFSYKSYEAQECLGFVIPVLNSCYDIQGVAYYYTDQDRLLIALGAVMFVAGILLIRDKANKLKK